MFRLLGKIEILGTKASIDKLGLPTLMPNGNMKQTGLKRKIPDVDSWCYASHWYRFNLETMDMEIHDFLTAHSKVGNALATRDAGIEYAFFTFCLVEQNDEERFGGVFSSGTLETLVNMGLDLQIEPVSIMPDAPYWKR